MLRSDGFTPVWCATAEAMLARFYAAEMERTRGKTRILQLYLDNAHWGEGVCGAEAAARHDFGVRARALQPRQVVWLASMLHAPDRATREWRQGGGIDVEWARWWLGRCVVYRASVPGSGAHWTRRSAARLDS